MNDHAERLLGPMLIERDVALLVFTSKKFAGWSSADAQALFRYTLPAVEKIEGVDANKLILIGYSAGGQMALRLWRSSPDRFGGLVLNSAFPLAGVRTNRQTGQRTIVLLSPPKKEAVKDVPIFAIYGEKEQAKVIWTEAEPSYRKAGVPLTIEVVKGAGHEWLFGGSQREKLGEWLDAVLAGQRPGLPTTQPAAETQDDDPLGIDEVF
jgi:predicted esterase